MSGQFNLKKLVEFGLHSLINNVGLSEVSQHVPDLASESLKHFNIPESIEMPLHLEVLGRVLVNGYQRQQHINEAWRIHNANPPTE